MSIVRRFGARAATRALSACALTVVALAGGTATAQSVGGASTPGIQQIKPGAGQMIPLDLVDRLVAPKMDFRALMDDSLKRDAEGGHPLHFAQPWDLAADTLNSGTWDNLDAQTLVWRLRVQSPGAWSLNFGFSRFHLPEGASLTIRATDGSTEIRPFTSADNAAHGELWTPLLPVDDVMIELVVPAAVFDDVQLQLGRISSGFREIMAPAGGRADTTRSGSCNLDVICGAADGWPDVDLWRDEIPATGAYTVGGVDYCTGSLINNTANDLTPYFLTANHCGLSTANDQSVVIYWNYESPVCRQPGSGASGNPYPKPSTFSSGTTYRASFSTSDFCLVEVTNPLDPAWELTFAGWDRSGADATMAVGIHHPNVDEKRISFEYDPTTITSYLGTSVPGDSTHVRITDWDVGTTEPGSSGSPLFNQNHQIIGQLHGGYAACGNNDSDYYGRFSRSWTGGGTSSSRLSDWLDPLNTGQMTLNTITGAGLSVDPADGVTHKGPTGGPFSGTPVDYTLSNAGPTDVDYEVSLDAGGDAPLLINGGTSPIADTLSGGGGSAVVTVSIDAAAAALLPVGSYSTDVVFYDSTNGRESVRTHTLDVGLTNFDVTPTTGLAGSGPNGGPFGQTRVYTVTSTQPNPVTVQCLASNGWISLDGGTSPVSFVLSGEGDSHQVTVGFSSGANALSPGFYSGSVSFHNASGGTGDTSRDVTLDAGRVNISSTDTPVAISDNSSFVSYIDVPDDVEIGDLNVKLDISHTYIGDLIVEVKSPAGTIVRLHDRTGGSTHNIVTTYDDATHAPDGPGALADFNGEQAMGVWTLMGSDNANVDTGTLNSWTLQIGAAALPPPDCVADLNDDEVTDVYDFTIFAQHFGTSVTPGTNGDYDGNGFVDVLDFTVLAANFGCPY